MTNRQLGVNFLFCSTNQLLFSLRKNKKKFMNEKKDEKEKKGSRKEQSKTK